jgi:hypothetical protein
MAWQSLASLAAQERVTAAPRCTTGALAFSSTAGDPSGSAGGFTGGLPAGLEPFETLTEALRVMLPPDPVHVSWYVALESGCTPVLP